MIDFNLQENGYDIQEVDRYIAMLQEEYQNAIAWGEEQESKFEAIKEDVKQKGVYFTIEEDNNDEAIETIFAELSKTVDQVRSDAQDRADEIIANANAKAKAIVRQAMENSVEIRTDNTNIMQNLKEINNVLTAIVEKGVN